MNLIGKKARIKQSVSGICDGPIVTIIEAAYRYEGHVRIKFEEGDCYYWPIDWLEILLDSQQLSLF